jgi:male sterility protein
MDARSFAGNQYLTLGTSHSRWTLAVKKFVMHIVGKFPLFLRKENLMSTHVVTGGTGFIGSAIILELLRQTDVEIISIVRSGTRTAEDRLYNALEKAGRAYDYDECFLQAAKKRCHVITGDEALLNLIPKFSLLSLPVLLKPPTFGALSVHPITSKT